MYLHIVDWAGCISSYDSPAVPAKHAEYIKPSEYAACYNAVIPLGIIMRHRVPPVAQKHTMWNA